MNNNLNKLFKVAQRNAAIKERKIEEVDNQITDNCQIMYLEIMKELINKYKKNPFDEVNEIEFNVPLTSPNNLTDEEKYYLNYENPLDGYYLMYESQNNKRKYLVNKGTLKTLFISSGIDDVTIEEPESNDKNNYYNFKIKFTASNLRKGIIKLSKDSLHVGQRIALKTILETARQEINYYFFQRKIEKNTKLMLIDINQELVEQYRKDPLSQDTILTFKKELRSGINTPNETEKNYVCSMEKDHKENYYLYDRPNSNITLLIYYDYLKYDLQSEGINNIKLQKVEDDKDHYIFEVSISTYNFEKIIKSYTKKKIFK